MTTAHSKFSKLRNALFLAVLLGVSAGATVPSQAAGVGIESGKGGSYEQSYDNCWDGKKAARYFIKRGYKDVNVDPGKGDFDYIIYASKKRVDWVFYFDGCRHKVVDKRRAEKEQKEEQLEDGATLF